MRVGYLSSKLKPWQGPKVGTAERLKSLRVPERDIVLFARQMSALYKGGIPLISCLEALSEQNENPDLGDLVADVAKKLAGGSLLSSSLAQYPQAFPKILRVMVRIGEETGALDASLQSAAEWLERDWELKRKVKGALSYPLFIFALTGTLTILLFYGVMPAFLKIFEDMKIDLPLATQVVLGFTSSLQRPAFWFLLVIVTLWGNWQIRAIMANDQAKRQVYEFLLMVPIWGRILHHGSLSRFCDAARTLLETGVNIVLTIKLAAEVCGNPVVEHDVTELLEGVKNGQAVSRLMAVRPEIYNVTTINFLAAGEETSSLPRMLAFASEYHSLEAESCIDAMKVAIEPLMLAVIAVVVGGIVLSIFLPLYSFLNKI